MSGTDGASERDGVRFGTDGVRATANRDALAPERILRLGRVVGALLRSRPAGFRNPLERKLSARLASPPRAGGAGRVVLGRDTRISGDMIAASLAAGLMSTGWDVIDAGVLPTPALAFLARERGVALGVMITASHNPFADNGIKLVSPAGLKIPDRAERAVEAAFADAEFGLPCPDGDAIGRCVRDPGRGARWVESLVRRFSRRASWRGLRVVLDCAHGAMSEAAPAVFRGLGMRVRALHAEPDGVNINAGAGALHPERLARAVRRSRAHAGFAFDGDGDRVIAVDRHGAILDGDHMLALLGRHLHARRRLPGDTVVTTVMANLGLRCALEEVGVRLLTTPVGDRHVLERMLRGGFVLGGEQSGHMIFLDEAATGDGVVTALRLLVAAAEAGDTVDRMARAMKKFPQVLVNVRVSAKPPLEGLPGVGAAVAEAERALAGRGRVLLRYSGTEPIARVMIEGEDARTIRRLAESVAAPIRASLDPRPGPR